MAAGDLGGSSMVMTRAMTRRAGMAAVALLAAACGQLESPDLATGHVAGRVAGVSATGGSVYLLGAPQVKAAVAADGSYELAGVPAGAQQLVVVAAAGGVARAEVVPVTVRGGMRERLDRDAAAMPEAATIVAVARPVGGARPLNARYAVERTDQAVEDAAALGAVLVNLPAAALPWTLATAVPGFQTALTPVELTPGTVLHLDVAVVAAGTGGALGCAATTCPSGTACNPADGQCYGIGTLSGFCEAAADAGACQYGVIAGGAGATYCSKTCADATECPAGWACGPGGVCAVVESCRSTACTFGEPCSRDAGCGDLAGGVCLRAKADRPGLCTAPCGPTQACPANLTCKPGPGAYAGASYCQP